MIPQTKKLFLIKWVDSYTLGDKWHSISDMETLENMYCLSVGWIFKETKNNILVIPHITDVENKEVSGNGCGMMVIPKAAIVSKKEIKC